MTFRVYSDPFPKPDSVVEGDEEMCLASAGGYDCTREADHSGDHQACGTAHLMLASWPQDVAQ